MKKIICFSLMLFIGFTAKNASALLYFVNIDQDADVISGTQWADENKSNQGANPEIEPIRANDGYDTSHIVYLGFNLSSNASLKNVILQGGTINSYKLHAYNVRNFAMGDAVIGDVITSIHYANNDNWWEGPYSNWTTIESSNPLDGMTYNNQVGYNKFLASENEDAADKWYSWEFPSTAFSTGGVNDNPNYLSLAMIPNALDKPSSWWLVSSFASKENLSHSFPYLEVDASPVVPEPSTILLLGAGLVGAFHRRRRIQQNTDDVNRQF